MTNMDADLEKDLAALLNRYSQENASNTPDFILAQYLIGCMASFNTATQQRETWYGRDARPTVGQLTAVLMEQSTGLPDV